MPEVSPDFSFPGMQAVVQIASWILAVGLGASIIGLIISGILVLTRGMGNQSVQQKASSAILVAGSATVFLGSISGIWSWLVGFDLGF